MSLHVLYLYVFSGFPPGISRVLYLLLQSFQRNERGFEALVLTLVSNLALICDHLSPSGQYMGAPKSLIRIEPEPTFPKFAAFENIHAYAYACILLW